MTISVKDSGGNNVTVSTADDLLATAGLPANAPYADATGAAAGTHTSVFKAIFMALKGLLTVDSVVKSAAPVDRGVVIGFTGAVISTTNASSTITLTTAPSAGGLVPGQQIVATNIPTGTLIGALLSGTANTANATYSLVSAGGAAVNATATGSSIAATSVGPQPLMAANAARRAFKVQNQSPSYNVWINDAAIATADYHSQLLYPTQIYETPDSSCASGAISVIAAQPATAIFAREL